jgi:hypothetical protein
MYACVDPSLSFDHSSTRSSLINLQSALDGRAKQSQSSISAGFHQKDLQISISPLRHTGLLCTADLSPQLTSYLRTSQFLEHVCSLFSAVRLHNAIRLHDSSSLGWQSRHTIIHPAASNLLTSLRGADPVGPSKYVNPYEQFHMYGKSTCVDTTALASGARFQAFRT